MTLHRVAGQGQIGVMEAGAFDLEGGTVISAAPARSTGSFHPARSTDPQDVRTLP
jgi:hypothetical protein